MMGKRAGLGTNWGRVVNSRPAKTLDRRELTFRLGFAKLGKRVNCRLALAGPDDGPMALIGGVGGVEGRADRAPRAAETVEDHVVLDRKLQPRAGELALNRQNRGKTPPIGQTIEIQLVAGGPTGIEQTVDGVGELHLVQTFLPEPV